MTFFKTFIAAAALSAIGTIAGAATLSVNGSTTSGSVPADFDLTAETGISVGDPLIIVDANNVGSLDISVSAPTTLYYTYLGSEALNENVALEVQLNSVLFNNKTSNIGETVVVTDDGDVVDFLFRDVTQNEVIQNGDVGNADPGLSIAFYVVDQYSVIALFGDGAGDQDYDDIAILISTVPLPAGALLLLTGLGGFAAMRRRKKA